MPIVFSGRSLYANAGQKLRTVGFREIQMQCYVTPVGRCTGPQAHRAEGLTGPRASCRSVSYTDQETTVGLESQYSLRWLDKRWRERWDAVKGCYYIWAEGQNANANPELESGQGSNVQWNLRVRAYKAVSEAMFCAQDRASLIWAPQFRLLTWSYNWRAF